MEKMKLFEIINTPKYRSCHCVSASITVEAALVIPLYIYAVLSIMYMMKVADIKKDMETALYNAVRNMSKYAYTYENITGEDSNLEKVAGNKENMIGTAYLYASILNELGENYCANNNIVGKEAGLIVLSSSVLEDDSKIKGTVTYSIRNPFDIFGLALVNISQTVVTEAWLGEDKSGQWEDGTQDKPDEKYVYITPSGTVYHVDKSCSVLKLSIRKVELNSITALRNKSGGKYYKCERCKSATNVTEVFITDYGDRYHCDIACSGLKRTVIEIPLSKVKDRRKCMKCGNN